jgi:hypothetical protein
MEIEEDEIKRRKNRQHHKIILISNLASPDNRADFDISNKATADKNN